jgi:hypothetical protein
MPKGGLGNLIALPLQSAPRKAGNAVFIDSDFHRHPDQWQFLSTIRRMQVDNAVEIVAAAQPKGDLIGARQDIANDEEAEDPWTLPPSRNRKAPTTAFHDPPQGRVHLAQSELSFEPSCRPCRWWRPV